MRVRPSNPPPPTTTYGRSIRNDGPLAMVQRLLHNQGYPVRPGKKLNFK